MSQATTQVMPAFLKYLQWTSLNNRRESLKIIMLHKIIQQLVDVPKSNLIPWQYLITTALETKGPDIYTHLQELIMMCITTPSFHQQ